MTTYSDKIPPPRKGESEIEYFRWRQKVSELLNNPNYPNLSVYANNAAALAGGLIVGDLYRTGADPDTVCVVHTP